MGVSTGAGSRVAMQTLVVISVANMHPLSHTQHSTEHLLGHLHAKHAPKDAVIEQPAKACDEHLIKPRGDRVQDGKDRPYDRRS